MKSESVRLSVLSDSLQPHGLQPLTKALDCVDHNKLWNILNEMRIPDHITCLLRNLYVGQEAAARIGHETADGSKLERITSRLYIVTLLI